MAPVTAGLYAAARQAENHERTVAMTPQSVNVNPALAIGGAIAPMVAAGVYAMGGRNHVERAFRFGVALPTSILGASIGRSIAMTRAYKKLERDAVGQEPWLPKAASQTVLQDPYEAFKQKQAMFDYITELPLPGGKYPDSKLEMEYMMDHPIQTTFRPFQIGGAIAGGLIGKRMGHPVAGAAMGYASGSIPEAVQRYAYLKDQKNKAEAYLKASRGE